MDPIVKGLWKDCLERVPVAQLRQRYTRADLDAWFPPERLTNIGMPPTSLAMLVLYRPRAPTRHTRWTTRVCDNEAQWKWDYLCWVFDECGIPLDAPAYRTYLFEPRGHHIMFPFDAVVCLIDRIDTAIPLEFFLQRNAPSNRGGVDWALSVYIRLQRSDYEWHLKRLLDAGATLSKVKVLDGEVERWFQSRLKCRKACYAILSLARRAPHLRKWMTRDIWIKVARQLWERHRFSF